jgi:hypothetical protein
MYPFGKFYFWLRNPISNYSLNIWWKERKLSTLVKFTTMNTTDILRNNIIDKLLTITNKDYLSALYQLVNSSSVDNDIVKLTDEQILMLRLSDDDIINGRLLDQKQLDKDDLQCLKGL